MQYGVQGKNRGFLPAHTCLTWSVCLPMPFVFFPSRAPPRLACGGLFKMCEYVAGIASTRAVHTAEDTSASQLELDFAA